MWTPNWRQRLDSNLLKYNAKGYFLQAIFCHLANGDSIAAQKSQTKYGHLDFTFSDSREGKLCTKLIEYMEQFDPEGFSTACYEYDRISKLDPWKTTLLVKVKRSIDDQASGEMVGGNAIVSFHLQGQSFFFFTESSSGDNHNKNYY